MCRLQVRLPMCWVRPTGFPFLLIKSGFDINRRFPDSDSCLEFLFRLRCADRVCPQCGRKNSFYRQRRKRSFMCSCGRHQIYPMAGTVFENSSLPLLSWFRVIHAAWQDDGLTGKEIQRILTVTYPTAWRMRKKLLPLLNTFRTNAKCQNFEAFLSFC